MAKHTKQYAAAAQLVQPDQRYAVAQAIELVKQTARANFDETVEVSIELGVDPAKGEQSVRGTVTLPHGTGKTPRVAVFAKSEAATAAEQAGADRVGGDELVEEVEKGWEGFDILVASTEMMRTVGRLGKKLGPRVPNKKAGTLAATPEEMSRIIAELKAGRVEFKMDKAGGLHVPIGKVSFENAQLIENFNSLLEAVVKARPAAVKGRFILGIALASTMGPGAKLDVQQAIEDVAA